MSDFYEKIESLLGASNLKGDFYTKLLTAIENFSGGSGGPSIPGKDGREVELISNGTAILWRYVGTSSWNTLVPLSDLKGDKGADGIDGADGPQGPKGDKGDKGDDGVVDPTVLNNLNTRIGQLETSVGDIVSLMEVL